MTTPLSVVIPVRNGERFIADSIGNVLDQKASNVELVVVDDGSEDRTAEIARSFAGVRLHRQRPIGVAAARNTGARATAGELLLFLDADDLLSPDFISRMGKAWSAARADVLHCAWRGTTLRGEPLYHQVEPLELDGDPFHGLIVHGSPPMNAMVVTRAAFERVGGFDESLNFQVDWDFWLRLAVSGARFEGVQGVEAIVRRHANSLSAVAGARLGFAGWAALERQLQGHQPCGICSEMQDEIAQWSRAALVSAGLHLARRLRLPGRFGRQMAIALVCLRHPRIARSAQLRLTERLSFWRHRSALLT